MKISTGLRSKLLDTGSLKTILAGGLIKIYSGALPADADAAVTGTLLCTVSNNSTGVGINLAAAATNGVIPKLATEVWNGVNAAAGTAAYFRHVAAGDDGTLSTTQARIQGTVAVAGGDLNISDVNLAAGAAQGVDYYSVALPAF